MCVVMLVIKAQEEMEEKQQKELRRRMKQQEKLQKREAYEALERQKRVMAEEMDRDLKGFLFINLFYLFSDLVRSTSCIIQKDTKSPARFYDQTPTPCKIVLNPSTLTI